MVELSVVMVNSGRRSGGIPEVMLPVSENGSRSLWYKMAPRPADSMTTIAFLAVNQSFQSINNFNQLFISLINLNHIELYQSITLICYSFISINE